MGENTKLEIFGEDSFIDNFQKDHSKLNTLFASFRVALEAQNCKKAKEILCQINDIIDGHFNFEETYLYPRLRRLVAEITTNLQKGQCAMRNFISKSKNFLDNNKKSKEKLSSLLDMLPQLSSFLSQCNDLVPLARKFNEGERMDLNKRLEACHNIRR